MAREAPYNRLKRYYRDWASSVVYAHRRVMFFYPRKKLKEGWTLEEIWQRTEAAQQIGYEVIVESTSEGLRFSYIKKRPKEIPYEATY